MSLTDWGLDGILADIQYAPSLQAPVWSRSPSLQMFSAIVVFKIVVFKFILRESIMFASILRACLLVVCVPLFVLAGVKAGAAQVAVTTWHYDNMRSGVNPNETILTPTNVNVNKFGKLFTQPVDGFVIGQALYLPGVTIPGKGVHNVVYVATMHDSVYAFDADSASGQNVNPLWHITFLINGATSVPISLQNCAPTTQWTEVGVVSTPVIDPVAGTLYVVAKTYENSTFVHRLHALDVTTGLEKKGSPIVITASFEFNGTNHVFDDTIQVNRPALLLENGYLYIAFGSTGCRSNKEQGWVMSYNASTLQPEGAFDDEPDEGAAAIWQRGGGLSADSEGNIYGATADGDFSAGIDFGQSVLKLTQNGSTLELADWFTPFNELYLDENDLDLSEPVLILPNQSGTYPHLALAIGKEGTLYVMNRDNMGHFCASCTETDTQIVQELTALAPNSGALIYWNNTIYTSGSASPVLALSLTDGVLGTTPVAQSKQTTHGHSPVISVNGNKTASGVFWTINGPYLTAFNAVKLGSLIYSSGRAANGRDTLPPLPHFANVMVNNGKVYVGTKNSLVVYGLLN